MQPRGCEEIMGEEGYEYVIERMKLSRFRPSTPSEEVLRLLVEVLAMIRPMGGRERVWQERRHGTTGSTVQRGSSTRKM